MKKHESSDVSRDHVSPWAHLDEQCRRSARKYRALDNELGAAFSAVQDESWRLWFGDQPVAVEDSTS